ncbi:DNA ligase 4 [Platanthera guangdongensis]|uniref:DNA ligase 4 n=1 Tax=Platanthera guangdongensis TaxID=2320717 RepID=A0ABR2MNR8_9ASPA
MSDVILHNVLVDRCILDGEMLVWDTSSNRFAEFGSNQEIAKAAMQGLQGDRQLCYVAFDILYAGDTSVIHQSLTERQELLQKVVKPSKGHLEVLLPDNGLNDHCPVDESCWSIIANCVEDVEKFFKETIEKRDEGIVLKDLGSKWEPGDRSGKWLKLKPDYVHAAADLDVLIIGGYFGSGRHGGEVAQFLVGLAERSDSTSFPKRFISFCRVGSGLSDEDLDILITRLKPYFRKNEYPKRLPHFYEVTNNSKERPDVWVESPDKSVILSITSDIRTIKSEVFAAPYSLRFPRIQRVRYDKPWNECLDVESFRALVLSSNGNTQRGMDQGALQNPDVKPKRSVKKGEKRGISVIAPHSIQADISTVKEKTLIFANMMFYFVNVPSSYSVDYFHKVVVENGGSFSMNLNDTVTHCIAAEKKGIKYQGAMRYGDVIHYSWVLDCCKLKQLVHIKPKYFLFFSGSSRKKYREEIDALSDYYYWDIDIEDIKQIFCNMVGSENSKMIEHYRKKYSPVKRMGLFHHCFIYLHEIPFGKTDFKVISELAIRRMKLEITMCGGKVCDNLQSATHLLVYAMLGSHQFDEIYRSFPSSQRHLLHQKELYVLGHNWLEDSLDKSEKLAESNYNLKPDSLEEFMGDAKGSLPFLATAVEKEEQSSAAYGKRKRGRRAAAKPTLRPCRRTRAKIGKRPSKLGSDGSESSESSEADPPIDATAAARSKEEKAADIADKTAGQIQDKFGREELVVKQHAPSHSTEMEYKAGDKLEVMTDPIQAMLLDMIPTLSQTQKNHLASDDSVPIPEGMSPVPEPEPSVQPAKKKVSYKDVAGELLKDW